MAPAAIRSRQGAAGANPTTNRSDASAQSGTLRPVARAQRMAGDRPRRVEELRGVPSPGFLRGSARPPRTPFRRKPPKLPKPKYSTRLGFADPIRIRIVARHDWRMRSINSRTSQAFAPGLATMKFAWRSETSLRRSRFLESRLIDEAPAETLGAGFLKMQPENWWP